MKDYLGHEMVPVLGQFVPRSRQWVKFRLRDADKHVALAEQGAYTTADGSLVAIFQGAHQTAIHKHGKADGSVEISGGDQIPDRLVLVDKDGNNFSMPVRRPGGHGEFVNVFFFPASPNVTDVRPLEDFAELPPGYVGVHNDPAHKAFMERITAPVVETTDGQGA